MNGHFTEPVIRLGCFGGVLLLMALWEMLAPRRPRVARQSVRWLSNLSLVALNTLAVRVLFPLGAVGITIFAQERGWGLFNAFPVADWLALLLTVVIFDLVIYL